MSSNGFDITCNTTSYALIYTCTTLIEARPQAYTSTELK